MSHMLAWFLCPLMKFTFSDSHEIQPQYSVCQSDLLFSAEPQLTLTAHNVVVPSFSQQCFPLMSPTGAFKLSDMMCSLG